MSQAKLIPGQPAVTETVTRIITPETPPGIQLNISIKVAWLIVALLGKTNGDVGYGIYKALKEALREAGVTEKQFDDLSSKVRVSAAKGGTFGTDDAE